MSEATAAAKNDDAPVGADAEAPAQEDGYGSTKNPSSDSDTLPPEEPKGRFFPFGLFFFIPGIDFYLPVYIAQIQNFSHLVLVLGTFASFSIMVDTIYSWSTYGCRAGTLMCEGRIVPLLFVSCCFFYFVNTIKQFDGLLEEKKYRINKAQKKVYEAYKETVGTLETYVKGALTTNVKLAEVQFDGYRKDIVKFLTRYGNRISSNKDASFLNEFRKFLIRWFSIFAECSIDPINKPLCLVPESELKKLDNASAVATKSMEALKAYEVKFLQAAQEEDAEKIEKIKSSWGKMWDMQQAAQRQWEAVCGSSDKENDEAATLNIARTETGTLQKTTFRWVQWGSSESYGKIGPDEQRESYFPMKVPCGCCLTIIILSVEHLKLMLSFLAGFGVLFVETQLVDKGEMKKLMIVEIIFCMIGNAFILYEFLDIDICQKLEKQLAEARAEQKSLDEKRTSMQNFYANLEDLSETWLHHTLLRLELMKQFHEELSVKSPSEGGELLLQVNPRVEELEASLPPLDAWLTKDAVNYMKTGDEKVFGEALTQLSQSMSSQGVEATLDDFAKTAAALTLETKRVAPLTAPDPEDV